jgi:hypothetical protein
VKKPLATEEEKRRCLVRQVLAWHAEGRTAAVDAVRMSPAFDRIKDDVNRQWHLGNRGATVDWREAESEAVSAIDPPSRPSLRLVKG